MHQVRVLEGFAAIFATISPLKWDGDAAIPIPQLGIGTDESGSDRGVQEPFISGLPV